MKKVLFAVTLFGCTDKDPPITGTTSLEVTLVSPTDAGDVDHRLDATARNIVVNVQAKDANGNNDATYSKTISVYTHYLGTLTPYLDKAPLLPTFDVTNGVASNVAITLPEVFGPTTVWFDDHRDDSATYATGISPTLWYRDPFIADIQTPLDETALDAFQDSPLENKNITINQSRYGAEGKLVVTSTFAQGYTVADVKCTNGMPPCVAQPYDYVEVFSFSAPTYTGNDSEGNTTVVYLSEGQTIAGFAGGISEFNGLTEIGFPQTFVGADSVIDKTLEPATVKIDSTWFTTNKINFERNEAGAIEIDNSVVCPLDDDYTTYKQWKIDPSGVGDAAACGGKNVINIITAGVVEIDPGTLVGKTVPRIVGILRPVNIGSFNVWIIYPRSLADITT
ncbi:MAG: hypothetical protein QM831_30605 [Kofleriaceae bacterium]